MVKINIKLLKSIDFLFVLNVIVILIIGIIVLPSASSASLLTDDPFHFVRKQAFAILIGFIAMVIVASFNYNHLQRYIKHIYVLNIFLLISVFILGSEVNGAKSWIKFGPMAIQPSEFSKILMIICFADFLSKRKDTLDSFKGFLACFAFFAMPLLLILLEPDLGTALVLIAIMLGMMLVGGANLTKLSSLVIGGLLVAIIAIWAHFKFGLPLPLKNHQIMRLVAFIDPYADGQGGRGAGYHIIQSMVAVGSGGFLGKGLFKGSQVQLNFLPEHHTDFIFSVIGEELGFVGGALLLLLFFSLLYRAVKIAFNARDQFGTLIVIGISSMIAFHILVNVGMTISMMPITGIPLPFISYGGSSMLSNLISIGLILNINMRHKKITF